ncbi:MAG: hypothetical protein ACHQAY_00495 [Hyphomicrobiales bacterium]
MKSISLAIRDEISSKVRRYTAAHDTTVDTIIREHLAQIAKNEDRLREVVAKLRRMSETSPAELGPDYTWNREDCHER